MASLVSSALVRRTCLLLALTLAAAALPSAPADKYQFSLFMDRQPTPEEINSRYHGAKFEPKNGCYVGAFLDLDFTNTDTYLDQVGKTRRMPDPFEAMTDKPHASYFFYMAYGSRTAVDWISLLAMQGKAVHIALEPNNGLEYVKNDAYLNNLADALHTTGAKIFLRFASEMNGPWVKYHGNPKLYKEKFQLVAKVMREKAPNVAMVWCPYTTPTSPIKSYYPGDAAVDWVGVNMYSVTYFNQDRKQPASHINPVEMLDYVYSNYAGRKPMMIGEFGATHWSALEGSAQTSYAQRCIQSLYAALPRKYPRVKAVFYFNSNNIEVSHRQNNNYAVTQSKPVLQAYKYAVSHPYFLSRVPDGESSLPEAWPMPAKDGAVVSGEADFSVWAKAHESGWVVAYFIDGRTLHTSKLEDGWGVTLDTNRIDNGSHTLEARLMKNGRTYARKSVRFIVDN